MTVLVLMSTYNGERYLKEQIDSILTQGGVEVKLLVRDDGSNDNTCKILDEYACKYESIEVVKAENVGFVNSFSDLVAMAQDKRFKVDYYAFSDQDDVWMPYKLKTACDNLVKMDQNMPLLFSSNSIIVDDDLNIIRKFHEIEPYRTKENVILYPTEQGCSMVFNRIALDFYIKYRPSSNVPHDRWMHMICSCFGSTAYEQSPLFYYRIHSNNAIGLDMGFLKRVRKDIEFFIYSKSKHQMYAREFYDSFKLIIPEDSLSFYVIYLNYPSVLKYKLKMLFGVNYYQSLNIWNMIRKGVAIILNKV